MGEFLKKCFNIDPTDWLTGLRLSRIGKAAKIGHFPQKSDFALTGGVKRDLPRLIPLSPLQPSPAECETV